jgi:vitamin B12 transporter
MKRRRRLLGARQNWRAAIGMFTATAAVELAPSGAFAQDEQQRHADVMIVSASATPLEAPKVGSAVTLVTADDLKIEGIQYAVDALRHVPGVAVNRAGSFGAFTQVRVRGAESNHTLVLIDGVEVAGASSGEFDFSSLLADGIERIEVLRGPQSGIYGANAMAGVVSVMTAGGAGASQVEVSAEAGSFGTTQVGLTARGGSEEVYGAVTLTSRQTDGFNASQLGSEKDADDHTVLFGRGVAEITNVLSLDGSFRVADKESDTDGFDFSGGPNQGMSIDSADFSNTNDAQIAVGAQWSLRDGGWITRLDAVRFDGEMEGGVDPFGSETTRDKIRLQTTLELGATGSAQFLTAFLENEDETYRNTVPFDPTQVPELSRGITGLGVEYRAEINDRLFLSGALRDDDNDGFEDATTYRLTAAYLVGTGNTRLHGSYGTGATNPTFFEQFGFIPGLFVGNPALEPEEVTGWDVGVERFFGDRMAFDITYFDADLENEIVDAFPSVANDAGTSQRSGVEVALRGEVTGRLSISAMYTFTDAEDPDGTEEVRRPENTASLDFTYRLERATVYGGMIYNGRMLDDDFRDFFVSFAAEKSPIDAYTLVNIGAYFDVTQRLELYGRVQNLFDEEYEEAISYGTMGRAAFAGFRYRLGGP